MAVALLDYRYPTCTEQENKNRGGKVHIIIATCMAQQASKGEEIDQLNSNNIAD
jgi:hypothetical protein